MNRERLTEDLSRRIHFAPNGCWEWTGSKNRAGYAYTTIHTAGRRRTGLVHRFLYEERNGPIPAGLVCDHLCRTRHCVNPDHLEAVTNAENLRRGNSAALLLAKNAAQASKTHCLRGHPLSGANVRRSSRGTRSCRTCGRIQSAAYRAAQKETAR